MRRDVLAVGVGVLAVASVVAVQGTSPQQPEIGVHDARQELAEKAAIPGTSWSVDPETDKVTVTADKTVSDKEMDKLTKVTDDLGDVVELEKSNTVMQTYVSGGDSILSGERCSAGFNVMLAGSPFMVTAGHCGKKGSTWRGEDGKSIGKMVESVFPKDDYALVKYDELKSYPSEVNLYEGVNRIFTVGTPTAGMQVERSGSTTGVQKGRITGLNATANYGNGISVDGLIQTNICAEPGDSGGPLFSGGMALGLLSGGYGDCKAGGTTFYQPLNQVTREYGMVLPE